MLAGAGRVQVGADLPRRRRRARLRPLALAPPPRPARDADGLVAGQGLRMPVTGRLAAVECKADSPADERPPAPWGSFPLAELTILAGIVMLGGRRLRRQPDRDRRRRRPRRPRRARGRDPRALRRLPLPHDPARRRRLRPRRRRCSSTPPARSWRSPSAIGAVAFALAFLALRRAFQRASGGLCFRVGGMRGRLRLDEQRRAVRAEPLLGQRRREQRPAGARSACRAACSR